MWEQIYDFFTRYTGVSYDFYGDIQSIKEHVPYVSPRIWKMRIELILKNLNDAMDCIEEYGDNLTDDMPSKSDLKKIVAQYVLGSLVKNLNEIKQALHIDNTDLSNLEDYENQVEWMRSLLAMLAENSLDEILSNDLFESEGRDDEEDDNQFVEIFGLHKDDVPNLSMTVQSIRQDYFDSLDDEEE